MLTKRELERYKRQMTLKGFGEDAQNRLKESTVLVSGIGGLGGSVATYLAVAGVGRLILIHEGNLTDSNMNRQTLMRSDKVGTPRIPIAQETLRQLNPEVKVEGHNAAVSPELLESILPGTDLAIDCRHNFPERRILNRAALKWKVPLVETAMDAMSGWLFTVEPGKTACLDCVFPDDPPWEPFGFSVLGSVAGMMGTLAALESIKMLTGFSQRLDRMLICDLDDYELKKLKVKQREDCICRQH